MDALTLIIAASEGPAPEDVKAGWVALLIFLLFLIYPALAGIVGL